MEKTALLVVDVQNAMFADSDPVFESERLVANISTLLHKARESATPVIYIQHNESSGELVTGSEAWRIYPAVAPLAGDTIVQKTAPDSFYRTSLEVELQRLQVTHLVICGMQTEICVDTTVRSAFSHGYKVTLAADAHSTWPLESLTARQIIDHHNRALRWFAEVKNSADVKFDVSRVG